MKKILLEIFARILFFFFKKEEKKPVIKKKEGLEFDITRYTKSDTAARQGIDNRPTAVALSNMKLLHEKVIYPISVHFGKKKIKINSVYRSPELNEFIGASPRSQHVKGQAVDIEIWGMSNLDFFEWIKKNMVYDQLILEFFKAGEGPMSGWCHISYKRSHNRGESFKMHRMGKRIEYSDHQKKNISV